MFKNELKKISICISLLFIFFLIIAPLSLAQNDSRGIPDPLGGKSFIQLIEGIIDALTPIAIAIAVIMIIYSGLLFMTAGGNEEKISTARKALIWSLVGLAVILIGSGFIGIIKDLLGVK